MKAYSLRGRFGCVVIACILTPFPISDVQCLLSRHWSQSRCLLRVLRHQQELYGQHINKACFYV